MQVSNSHFHEFQHLNFIIVKISWVTGKRSLLFLFSLLFFLAEKDNFKNKEITYWTFFEKKFYFFLKNVSQYNFFSRFQGKVQSSYLVDFVNFYEEDVRFLIKGDRNFQDPFFQKSFFVIFGAMMSSHISSVFNLLCVK